MRYISIRVVEADSREEAVRKVQENIFDESHELCDQVIALWYEVESALLRTAYPDRPASRLAELLKRGTERNEDFSGTDSDREAVLALCDEEMKEAIRLYIEVEGECPICHDLECEHADNLST